MKKQLLNKKPSNKKDMNTPELRKWIKELRSGNWRQEQGKLQSDKGNRYCCLGVACMLFIPKENLLMNEFLKNILQGSMPNEQPKAPSWLKKIDDDFERRTGKGLANLNDDEKMSFQEIADCLEITYIHAKFPKTRRI